MMTKRKILIVTGIFLAILAIIRLLWIAVFIPPHHPEAVRGVLDLREWDFTVNQTIALDGEWTFYPGQLVADPTNGTDDAANLYIPVPANWSPYLSSSQAKSALGFGSFRVRILVDSGHERIYSIRLPSISSSSEVFVNGKSIARAGQPADSSDQYKARNVPYTASFTIDGDEIDLVVHIANFHDQSAGGIERSLKFGVQEAVSREVAFAVGTQLAVCLILLLHAIYTCILYGMGIRQKALLYFGLVTLCATITVLIDDDMLLLNWLPINFDWAVKLNHLFYLGVATFLFLYTKHLLPAYANFRLISWYTRISAAYAIFIPFASASILQPLDLLNIVMILIPLLIVPWMAWRSTLRDEPDAIFLLLGMVGIMNNMLWALGKVAGFIEIGFYPVDIVVSFIAFAGFWFKSYLRTSRKTTELAARLRKADKLKDDFLVNTSHELRNPLHAILSIAQTIHDKEDRTQNRESLHVLITVGKRMSLLLGDLLDLTRLKENRIRLQTADIRVQTLAAGVLDMCRLMTTGKPIQFLNRIPDSFPSVVADENRLLQIFFNLVHNATKFTDKGWIAIEAHEKEDRAYFHIVDTGSGMDEPTQETIFRPYEQGSPGNGGSASGLGLGLSICKQLVELHGGELTVESVPGQGSTFTFSLPLSDPSAQSSERSGTDQAIPATVLSETAAAHTETTAARSATPDEATAQATDSDRPTILAVDDDPINLQILVASLSLDRYDIVTATSGQAALAILNTREWDLVIADVMMPRMSGYELCLAIRERFSAPELPILLLTARARTEDIKAGFQAGANDYVTKPVDTLELASRVESLTALRKSVREKLRLEAAWLQAQIQPHFLFNTLNSVAALSDIDSLEMRKLLEAFGHYLRSSFAYKNLERFVPLEHELGLVRSYLYIEKKRFEERLEVVWDIDNTVKLMVPPLSIQPLVENAVRHGLMRTVSGGQVTLQIKGYGNYAEISIKDNGVGMDEKTLQRLLGQAADHQIGVGLSNTNRRLIQLYGEGLRVNSTLGQGTTVSFIVPDKFVQHL